MIELNGALIAPSALSFSNGGTTTTTSRLPQPVADQENPATSAVVATTEEEEGNTRTSLIAEDQVELGSVRFVNNVRTPSSGDAEA